MIFSYETRIASEDGYSVCYARGVWHFPSLGRQGMITRVFPLPVKPA